MVPLISLCSAYVKFHLHSPNSYLPGQFIMLHGLAAVQPLIHRDHRQEPMRSLKGRQGLRHGLLATAVYPILNNTLYNQVLTLVSVLWGPSRPFHVG